MSDREFYQGRTKEYRIALVAVSLVLVSLMALMPALVIAAPVVQATATPRQFCHVQYLVFVHNGVRGVNVRPTPSKNTTPLFTVNSTQNPQSAIGLENGWFQLCSISGQYMISDPELNIAVSVTPGPTQAQVTPTRLVSNTPSPQPSVTATGTPAKLGKRICIEYDNEQGLQDACGLFPLNARVVSIEVVTEEPAR